MGSLRASARGLEIVERARRYKRWTKSASAWWQAALTSEATLKRFWQQQPIQQETFIKICEAVGVSNWNDIVDRSTVQEPILDWGEAPDVCGFYGRTEEQDMLRQWIVTERCRLVALWGMGGIGKSALAATLANRIQGEFEYLIWRSLRSAPPVQEILASLLRFLSHQQETVLPDSVEALLSKLMSYLHKHRYLLVLDNFETVLRSGELAGQYCEGYSGYGEIIRRVGEERHQSCLVVTSREKPKEISLLEGKDLPVRSLAITGLRETEAREIFSAKGLSEPEQWGKIIKIYQTNPLVLKIVSAAIKESFNGRVGEFLRQNTIFLGDISEILDQQFERLSELEQEIMHRLAINYQPISINQLRQNVLFQVSTSELIYALQSLGRRSLLEQITEKSEINYTLQPVVRRYVNKRLK